MTSLNVSFSLSCRIFLSLRCHNMSSVLANVTAAPWHNGPQLRASLLNPTLPHYRDVQRVCRGPTNQTPSLQRDASFSDGCTPDHGRDTRGWARSLCNSRPSEEAFTVTQLLCGIWRCFFLAIAVSLQRRPHGRFLAQSDARLCRISLEAGILQKFMTIPTRTKSVRPSGFCEPYLSVTM